MVTYVGLIIIATLLGYEQYKNWKAIVAFVLIAAIPGFYSLVPYLKEKWYELHTQKDEFTERTFTDRQDDLDRVLYKLVLPEHVLEIKGNNEKCGKTWLAKRLCDYINHPKDKKYANVKIKSPYKRAFYKDMDHLSEEDLTIFFHQHIINSKAVLIFDHVTNLELILKKQSIYHFQLVYILKENRERDFSTYTISDFSVKYIGELHEKLRENYPGLSEITEHEISILHKITNGNIGKITALLSEERCIRWIKDIGNHAQTEYDEKLNSIQASLYAGRYREAQKELDGFEAEYKNSFDQNNDLFYKYILIHSDCEHLLNHYENALNILSIAENLPYRISPDSEEIELSKAHYLKHLWRSDDALVILIQLKSKSYRAIVDSLGILLAKYFIDDLHVPMYASEGNSRDAFFNFYTLALNSEMPHTDDDMLKLKRCMPIYNFYKVHPSDNKELMEQANEVITIYRAQHNRLLANAYFIKGELLRLYGDYNNAVLYYKKALTVTADNNIIVQTNLMIYYLKKCKHIDMEFELLDSVKIGELCQNNHYAERVFKRIHCIELQDPNWEKIQQCFEERLMPIL